MNCDNCKYYKWYHYLCNKWDCEVEPREVHNCFEPMETPILNAMLGRKQKDTKGDAK